MSGMSCAARLREAARRRPWAAAAPALALVAMVAMVGRVMAPWLSDTSTYGFHDWDVVTSYRYLVVESLRRHHELPWWNPYACGGYPSWGYVEGATNLVSPWLPVYLLAPLSLAIRIEAAGMGLLGALGAYAAASCFGRSHGARLLVVALWAVNGRWGLQTASGHAWHLAYAYLPWCLFFFERALGERRRLRDVTLLGVCFALLVYAGGIYPLPHTVLGLGLYAAGRSVSERSARPLAVLLFGGLVGLGLAAPKLLPMLDTFAADPRLIESREELGLGALVTLLTHAEQPFYARPARVHPYGWHEWGMYISWIGLWVVGLAALLGRGRRETPLRLTGVAFVLLGFGAFHPLAPWTLLHQHLPLFRSQHVPSRFLYPAVLLLALVASSHVGRFVARRARRRPWLDTALVAVVALVGLDVAGVAAQPMKNAMWMEVPDIPAGRRFHFEARPPFQYKKRDWAGPMLLAMMGNTGVIDCYGVPRGPGFRPGAVALADRRYRGEVYLADGRGRPAPGEASIERWTPNRVAVRVSGATPGSLLVYNMNHRRGWRASVGEVRAFRGAVATRLEAGQGVIELWYRPPRLGLGLALLLSTVLALVALRRQDDD